jgi:hypothetical protein
MSIESIVNYSREEKVQQFLMLIKDPEVQPVFRLYIENILATSELKILKRLAAVETAIGLNDFSDFEDENHELTIPEQLSLLAERIDNITEPIVYQGSLREPVDIPTSKTEVRASLLVEQLKDATVRTGTRFLSSDEIVHFLRYDIDERYRVKDGQNVRQVKKEVLEKAIKMFPDDVYLSKKTQGRKNVRIVHRP